MQGIQTKIPGIPEGKSNGTEIEISNIFLKIIHEISPLSSRNVDYAIPFVTGN